MTPLSSRRRVTTLSSFLLLLVLTPQTVYGGPRAGGGFSLTFDSGMFEDEVLNENQEAYELATKPWTIQALPRSTRNEARVMETVSKVSNRVVAKEVAKILMDRPLVLELSAKELKKRTGGSMSGKYRRAVATTARKVRVAGGKGIPGEAGTMYRAVWKRDLAPNKKFMSPPGVRNLNNLDNFENMSLKDAMKQTSGDATTDSVLTKSFEENMSKMFPGTLEVEVTIPNKKGMNIVKKRGYTPPVIVYTFPFGEGDMNPESTLCRSEGCIKVYPYGRKIAAAQKSAQQGPGAAAAMEQEVEKDEGGIEIGVTTLNKGARAPGLVDPSWARGKKFFWKGRAVGHL
mmetsp:Transcript_21470/g.31925  ORF Transcript_21470/g.31925 Transcript_21470/m.31925 type:complete len:344 (-) Transcript_21470:320-1351(-)